MQSVKANFRKIQKRNPNLGSYIILAQTVKGKKFSRKAIRNAFKELVPESEYSRDEQKHLISYLENLSNTPEEVTFQSKNPLSKKKS